MHTIQDNSVDVAGICETWFNESCNPATAIIKSFGYSIIHNFRKEKKGGGTALIFKSSFKLSPISFSQTFTTFEITAATSKTDQSKVIFVVVYRTGPLSSKFLQELDVLLADLCSQVDAFILSGDFNIRFFFCGCQRPTHGCWVFPEKRPTFFAKITYNCTVAVQYRRHTMSHMNHELSRIKQMN